MNNKEKIKKDKERKILKVFLSKMTRYAEHIECERPDFIIKDKFTNRLIGLEITIYYPHRNKRGAVVLRSKEFKYQYFEEYSLGCIRVVQFVNKKDFLRTINNKEKKLSDYRNNHPECSEFWLLIKIPFEDGVDIEQLKFTSEFSRIFLYEEPNEIKILK